MTISDLALRIRVEPIAHLHERAEALGVGCKWTGRGRASLNAAAVATLAAARRPHRPVASADTDIEIFGRKSRSALSARRVRYRLAGRTRPAFAPNDCRAR